MSIASAGAAIIGTLIVMQGQRDAARSEAAAASRNAQLKRLQALELLDRFDINARQLFQEGELFKADQELSFASRGVDISSGSALNVIHETNATVLREYALQKREAQFKAEQLMAGADIDQRLAGDIQSSASKQRLGTFLTGVGTVARQF